MNAGLRSLNSMAVFLYAWAVTIFFGAVLMDALYSSQVPQAAAGFTAVSDLLLPAGLVTFLAALGAIASAWKPGAGRYFFLASLAVFLLEFGIPLVFSQLKTGPGAGLTSLLRIGIHGLASLLAFAGLYRISRER